MGVRAVLFDYGHTLVDFRRTEEALLDAYEAIRARIEAALYMEAPEVGHLIDRVAGEIDRRVGASTVPAAWTGAATVREPSGFTVSAPAATLPKRTAVAPSRSLP